MIHKYIKLLQKVEKHSGVHLERDSSSKFPYKRHGKVWIRADKPIKDLYKEILKYSELPFYPNNNYKVWAVWILRIFKFKRENFTLRNLLGIGLSWRFLKTQYLPIQADIIYGRLPAITMIYCSMNNKNVVKVPVTNHGKILMKSEVASQRLASSIASNDVFIPSILKEYHDNYMSYTVEEYFAGKKQSFKNKKTLEINYHKVFEFLMKFYLKNPIKFQDLSESKFLNHDFVEEFIKKQDQGDIVISNYEDLSAKKKQMILCRIHGDLSHGNILSNESEVCVIDWGKSKMHYLARDLDNSSYDTESFYDEFIKRANIDTGKVYSYQEQLFLARFIEMNRLIHNGIKRKTLNRQLYNWVKSQNEVLMKMGKKL